MKSSFLKLFIICMLCTVITGCGTTWKKVTDGYDTAKDITTDAWDYCFGDNADPEACQNHCQELSDTLDQLEEDSENIDPDEEVPDLYDKDMKRICKAVFTAFDEDIPGDTAEDNLKEAAKLCDDMMYGSPTLVPQIDRIKDNVDEALEEAGAMEEGDSLSNVCDPTVDINISPLPPTEGFGDPNEPWDTVQF